MTCQSEEKTLNAYLIVPENEDVFHQYFKLESTKTGTGIKLNNDGVVISQKIAEAYKIGKGSNLTVKDSDGNTYTLVVSDVTENYIQNYIYMSQNLYSKVFGKAISYNMIVSNHIGDQKTVANNLLASGQIVSAKFSNDILQQAIQQSSSLNSVVLLLICIASMMAVIVLYNLTSINISERKREIATLKVLGFKDGETNEYIYREAFILTLISIGAGLLLGIAFHHYVIDMIERDEVVYFKTIAGLSFLWSFLITLVFTFIMQIVTYFNLKKINMIESLKSVE
jgi:putative ABC transport system permease protein